MFRVLMTLAVFCLSINLGKAGGEHHWDYWSNDGGPDKWATYWPACNGSRQSPIDITTSNVRYDGTLGNITFKNYDNVPPGVNLTVKNNGHSLTASFSGYPDNTVPTIMNGGLPGTFKLIQFHLHWGSHDQRGAEHLINNQSHAAELHLVHMNTKYNTTQEAKKYWDGLAVLGVFIKSGKTNDVFSKFINLTKYNVTLPKQTSDVPIFAPKSLLPTDHNSFYRYNGSLTTPGCNEAVVWTVFLKDIEISADQLHEFRKMKYIDRENKTKELVDSHRPTQPLHDRMVLDNFGGHTSATPSPTPTTSITPTSTSTTPSSMSPTFKPGNLVIMIIISVAYVLFGWK